MLLKEAIVKIPLAAKLKCLPDDCYIQDNFLQHSFAIGMKLESNNLIAKELLDNDQTTINSFLISITEVYYKEMHEALIESEVAWRKKRGRTG